MNKLVTTWLALVVVVSTGVGVLLAEVPKTPPPVERAAFLTKLVLDAHADIRDRLQAVQWVGEDLSRSDMDALCGFLRSHPGAEEKNMAGLRTLKNDLINALKDQSVPPAGLTATLIGMFHDQGQDFVTRDYAIQHLTTWYGRGATDSPDAKERIRAVLYEAVQGNTSIAGTALLGMHRLSTKDMSFEGADIDRNALRMVISSDTPLPARITAIQICAERGVVEALPAIEGFAEARGQTALQISAIAALGRMGRAEDAALLHRLESGDDIALRPAITAALKRLPGTLARREPN